MKVLKRTPEYLENRIRELEAELVRSDNMISDQAVSIVELKARAEKAERLYAEVRKDGLWYKARVAELEAKLNAVR